MAIELHQTQLDLDLDSSSSPDILASNSSDEEPLPPTPTRAPRKKTGRLNGNRSPPAPSVRGKENRRLQDVFSASELAAWYLPPSPPSEMPNRQTPSPDLANEIPRWLETQGSSSTPTSSRSSRSTRCSSMESSPSSSDLSGNTEALLKQILTEVQQTKKSFDTRLKELETVAAKKRKTSPSREIRGAVRSVYRCLQDDDADFGWDTSVDFTDTSNQEVLSKVVRETKAQVSDAPSALIKEAARTYFNSIAGLKKMKQSGKYKSKCAQQRRKNRIRRKLAKRLAALKATSAFTKETKEKWMPCVVPELVSSEDSADEEGDADFVVRPLLWRSNKVTNLFTTLDHKSNKHATTRSKKMTFGRKQGLPSDRPKPLGYQLPNWVFK